MNAALGTPWNGYRLRATDHEILLRHCIQNRWQVVGGLYLGPPAASRPGAIDSSTRNVAFYLGPPAASRPGAMDSSTNLIHRHENAIPSIRIKRRHSSDKPAHIGIQRYP